MKPRIVSNWPARTWWVRLHVHGTRRWVMAVSWPEALRLVDQWWRAGAATVAAGREASQ